MLGTRHLILHCFSMGYKLAMTQGLNEPTAHTFINVCLVLRSQRQVVFEGTSAPFVPLGPSMQGVIRLRMAGSSSQNNLKK